MDLSGGMRAAAVAGAALLFGGLGVTLHGIIRDDLPHSIGGGCLTLTALLAWALVLIRRWICDTTEERHALNEARRRADEERGRHFAGQAALECEQGRLNRDMAAERRALTVRLKAEREAMAAEFQESRDALIAETMEATVLMMKGRAFAPGTSVTGKLIRLFPEQQPQHQRERQRSREHGVVGP